MIIFDFVFYSIVFVIYFIINLFGRLDEEIGV